jgi:hypothetical protein
MDFAKIMLFMWTNEAVGHWNRNLKDYPTNYSRTNQSPKPGCRLEAAPSTLSLELNVPATKNVKTKRIRRAGKNL